MAQVERALIEALVIELDKVTVELRDGETPKQARKRGFRALHKMLKSTAFQEGLGVISQELLNAGVLHEGAVIRYKL